MSEHATIENSSAVAALKGLRVALVVPSFSAHGGSERQLQMLLPALREAGAMVKVFSASSADTGVPGIETRQEALRDSMGPWSRLRQAGAVAALADEIAACADVVEFQRVAPTALCRALSRRMPTMLSVYTPEHTCPSRSRYLRRSSVDCNHAPGMSCLNIDRSEHCLSYQDGRRFSWRERVRSLLQMRRNAAQTRLLSMVTFNSSAVAGLYTQWVGKPRQARVIWPPLEVGAASEPVRDRKRIVFAGRIEGFKGALDLVPILLELTDCYLDVCGDGSSLAALQEQVRNSGLEARVRFHGWRDRQSISGMFASAAIALVPSRCYEAWGMVGPEAIAQGCPVVAYDSGGIGEWCLPQFGTLVPVGDVKGLIAAARLWLERMAHGLDTSSWREEALRRWGMARFLREYAQSLLAAMAAYKAAR
jgi:glycosyltransferase involved in cell wall biosynthesis